jgi:hypothetical protein
MPSGAVTVGGLVINLAAETSQLKTDMGEGARAVDAGAKSMINSMTGVTESSDRATDAGARMVRQLKEEIATFGMTSEQLAQYKANLNGVGGEVEALMGRLNQMKAAQSGFTDQLAASEAQATQRIRDMVAASMAEVSAMNDVATATQGVITAQAAAASTGRTLAESQKLQILNMQGVAASMKAVQDGTVAMSADTQRILAQYDPLGAKLRALQADMATLRKEMGNSVDPAAIKAFQGLENEIAKTQALMASAAAQANSLGGVTGQLTLTQTQLIDRFKQQADTIGMTRSQMMAYQAAQVGVTEQTKQAIAAVKAHEDAIRAAAKAKEEERNQTSMLSDGLRFLAAGYAALKVGEYIKDATMLAARYETLDVVMGVVGKTAGYTKTQMDFASEGVAKQGITMTESRNSVIKLVQAHIDLTNASGLARIAQDAAVIGNINSSEAFERLVNGVARGNVLILRNIGINVNLQAAYAQMADSLGKSTRELTENERVQARLQAVMERGADIAGTYEAAMDTASKQITSMKRYSEDLKTTLGEVFTEALTIGVMAFTDNLKDANGEVSELAKNGDLEEWGHGLTKLFVALANEVSNAYTTFQKFDAFARHMDSRKAINAEADRQSKALSDYGNGMAEKGAVEKLRRIEAGREAALAEENADYVRRQAELSGNFDRFERAADEREAARTAKKKVAAAERLKVDQDYAKAATDILMKSVGKGAAAEEEARKAVNALHYKTYVGTGKFRDTEGREPKPKVDQADNTRLQDHLAGIERTSAADKSYVEYRQKLDDMLLKAGEISDEEYFKNKKEGLKTIYLSEQLMYDQEIAALRAHHNSTEAETAKNQKAIRDIEAKKEAAGTKYGRDDHVLDEEERLREKKLYDDIVKATTNAGVTSIQSLDDQIKKQREHNAEIGKTKEQIELAKKAQVEMDTKQLQSDADYLRDGLAKWELDDKSRAVYEIRLANLDGEIARRRTLAGLLDTGADAEAGAKAAAALDKYLDPTKAEKFGSALKGSLGTAARSMIDLTNAMEKYGKREQVNEEARRNAEIARTTGTKTQAEYLEDMARINKQSTKDQLGGYGAMASAAAGFFDEHSRGYQALMAVSQVFHAAELAMTMAELVPKAISAVLTQGTAGDPYTAFGRMAAMAAVVTGLGVAIGGIGGGGDTTAKDRQAAQGTGTVLGNSTAKSASISRAIELSASNSSTQIDYLSGMLTSLRNIETGISSFASQVVQGGLTDGSNVSLSNSGAYNVLNSKAAGGLGSLAGAGVGYAAGAGLTAFTSLAALGGPIGIVVGAIAGKYLGKALSSIMGGKQSLEDSGFTMDKTSLGAILANGAKANSYADIKTDGGWFHSDKRNTQLQSLGQDANVQFSLVIESLADSVTEAGKLLGVSGAGFEAQLNNFVVDIGKVSLKGKTGDEIQKELEAVFSKLGDQMAASAVGGLQQFQKVGEGYLETLVRVASDYAKVDASLQSIGKKFGAEGLSSIKAREDLIALMGGVDDFQSRTASFGSNFLTKAEQLAPVAKYVDDQLTALGLGYIKSRDQFKAVALGQDLSTAAGQKLFTSLMSLESAFAATHAAAVDLTKTEQEVADERKDLQDQLDQVTMTQVQLAAKARNALAEVNRPLYDLVQTAQKLADTATSMEKFRDAARSLNDSLLTGSLSVLTPEQQYAELRDQYQKTKAAALAGDTKAQDQVFNALNAFLTASQKLYSGDTMYQADFAMGQQDSAAMAKWASGQVDTARAQLDAMNSQTASLQSANTALNAANTILTTIAQNTTPAPIQSGYVLSNALSALGTAVKLLQETTAKQQSETAALRKDQDQQTGDTITANQEAQDRTAQTIVSGMSVLARAITNNQKVPLE